MAWEWVAPVATASVGVAGIVGTWLTGKQGRDEAKRISGETLTHQRFLAEEARKQQRIENAYVDALTLAVRAGRWINRVHRLDEQTPPVSAPALPTREEQVRSEVLINAFGSHAVGEKLDKWSALIAKAVRARDHLDLLRADPTRSFAEDPRQALEDARSAEPEARKALVRQIAAELGHRPID